MRVEVVAAIAGPVVEPVVAAPPVPVEAPPTVIVEPPPSEPASKEVPKETRSSSKVEAASSERAIVSTTKSSSDAKVDTARSKKHEPAPVEKKGGATLWIVLAILVVGGFAAWHFFGR